MSCARRTREHWTTLEDPETGEPRLAVVEYEAHGEFVGGGFEAPREVPEVDILRVRWAGASRSEGDPKPGEEWFAGVRGDILGELEWEGTP